jgi:hypothetical protein
MSSYVTTSSWTSLGTTLKNRGLMLKHIHVFSCFHLPPFAQNDRETCFMTYPRTNQTVKNPQLALAAATGPCGTRKCSSWFQVLTAVSMKMAVFWVVAQCRLVSVYQRFRGLYCFHHQGDEWLWTSENVGKLIPAYTALYNPEDSHLLNEAAVYLTKGRVSSN